MRRFLVSVSLLSIVSACGQSEPSPASETPPPAEIMMFSVSEPAKGVYEINWSLDVSSPVLIEALTVPAASGVSGILIGDALEGGVQTWTAPDLLQRYYFRLTPSGGQSALAAARVLPLEGGRNFRDLGGYETIDGRQVAWGQVYRSGVMSGLTPADYDYLDKLGIKVICDLRTAAERDHEPTNWQASPAAFLTFPDPVSDNASLLGSIFQKPFLTPEDVTAAMAGFYRETLIQQDAAYSAMFDAVAAGDVPLAFHCSAGKDRTGVGAALLLAALGVPETVIIEDYVLSDKLVDYRKEMDLDAATGADESDPYAFLRQLPPEIVDPLLRSDAVYIEAALDEAKARHGSVLGFIQAEYDVSDDELEAIRTNLLVD